MHWNIVIDNFDYFLWGQTKFDLVFPFIHDVSGLLAAIILAVVGIFGAFWIGLAAGLMRLSKKWYIKLRQCLY